jgi:putative membrane protein
MEGFLIRAVVVGIGLWLASKIVSGIAFSSTETLIAAALLLGIVNAFVRPVIVILTLPITLLTLGLFLLVINALMIMLVAWFLPGFLVAGFWSAVFAAIVVSLTSWVMSRLDRPARPDRSHDGAPAACEVVRRGVPTRVRSSSPRNSGRAASWGCRSCTCERSRTRAPSESAWRARGRPDWLPAYRETPERRARGR